VMPRDAPRSWLTSNKAGRPSRSPDAGPGRPAAPASLTKPATGSSMPKSPAPSPMRGGTTCLRRRANAAAARPPCSSTAAPSPPAQPPPRTASPPGTRRPTSCSAAPMAKPASPSMSAPPAFSSPAARHHHLHALGIETFFCDPHAPPAEGRGRTRHRPPAPDLVPRDRCRYPVGPPVSSAGSRVHPHAAHMPGLCNASGNFYPPSVALEM